jgi:hypothetical protein
LKRIAAVVVTLALAGTIVAAMASAAAAKPLTANQFKKEANAICAEGNEELDALAEQVFGDLAEDEVPDEATLQEWADAFVPNIEGQIEDIDALEEPKSLSKKVDKFLAEALRALDVVEDDPSILTGDTDPFAKTSKLANKVGLAKCAE